ncbi:MAG: cytochrome P450 [Candidatus Binatia bacterium]
MDYNPLVPEVMTNPYPYYTYLRRHAPVYKVESLDWWAITHYDDIMSIVKDYQRFSNEHYLPAISEDTFNPFVDAPMMVGSDPPVHTRLRKLVNRAFTPRIIASLEPRIQEITQALLAKIAAKGAFDLMQDFAIPLPVQVIGEMLGVELERRDDFKRWTDTFAEVIGGKKLDAQQQQDIVEYRAYIQHLIQARRKAPQSDLISELIRAEEEEQRLTVAEIFNIGVLLLIAGNETTTNLIGNTVLALLKNPGELAKVRTNPALVTNLVEEGLRYDSPVQAEFRHTTEEVTLRGVKIPAKATVLILFGSGNRDEEKFGDPDRFDTTRPNAQENIAFGYGIHFCLGAPLARLEGQIALEALVPLLSQTAWQEEQVTRRLLLHQLRGLLSFPMTLKGY